MEKVEAARDAGAVCVVIRRPVSEAGHSLEEIEELLKRAVFAISKTTGDSAGNRYQGNPDNMTVEAVKSLRGGRLHHRCKAYAEYTGSF